MTAPLGTDGPAAPPRANGELVFAEPWEGRAFGMAVTLAEQGLFTWDEFRDALIARIAAREARDARDGGFGYYRCWLDALEDLLVGAGALSPAAVAERSAALAERPAGHDHLDGDGDGDGDGDRSALGHRG